MRILHVILFFAMVYTWIWAVQARNDKLVRIMNGTEEIGK